MTYQSQKYVLMSLIHRLLMKHIQGILRTWLKTRTKSQCNFFEQVIIFFTILSLKVDQETLMQLVLLNRINRTLSIIRLHLINNSFSRVKFSRFWSQLERYKIPQANMKRHVKCELSKIVQLILWMFNQTGFIIPKGAI